MLRWLALHMSWRTALKANANPGSYLGAACVAQRMAVEAPEGRGPMMHLNAADLHLLMLRASGLFQAPAHVPAVMYNVSMSLSL